MYGIAPEVGPLNGETAVELEVSPCLSSNTCCEASRETVGLPVSTSLLNFSTHEIMITCKDVAGRSRSFENGCRL